MFRKEICDLFRKRVATTCIQVYPRYYFSTYHFVKDHIASNSSQHRYISNVPSMTPKCKFTFEINAESSTDEQSLAEALNRENLEVSNTKKEIANDSLLNISCEYFSLWLQKAKDQFKHMTVSNEGSESKIDFVKPVLIDVREKWERDICTLTENEIHIPVKELNETWIQKLKKISSKNVLVIYCHHGNRSVVFSKKLMQHGINRVINLEDGCHGWALEVDKKFPKYYK